MERLAVSPETVTVLGYDVKTTDGMWRGLDFSKAEPRQQASLMLAICGRDAPSDIHLNVPFCEPGAPADDYEDCWYRVRPKMEVGKRWKGREVKSVAFEKWDGVWVIAVEMN